MKKQFTQADLVRIGKVTSLNLIPIAGIVFFDWRVFEIAMTYLLETFVAFFIFFFDRYLIVKKTRYPIPFGIMLLIFVAFPFSAFVYMYSFLCFIMTEPTLASRDKKFDWFYYRLEEMHLVWVIIALLIFEAVHYAIKNQNNRDHKSSKMWYNIRKLMITHFFILGGVFVVGPSRSELILPTIFVILFKVVLDYVIEDENFFVRLKKRGYSETKK